MLTVFVVLALLVLSTGIALAALPQFSGNGTVATGTNQYVAIDVPANQQGLRIVVTSGAGTTVSLRQGTTFGSGNTLASDPTPNSSSHGITVIPVTLSGISNCYLQISTSTASTDFSYSVSSAVGSLIWDPGTAASGTNAANQPDSAGGDYYFKITHLTSLYGAWRTALKVNSGEADLYLQQGAIPTGGGNYSSAQIGDDGFIINDSQVPNNQDWYIRVHAGAGSQWSLVSGDLYVQDLGTVAADGSSGSGAVTIGPEGTYFFKTSVDVNTEGWRLWLNGATLPINVRKAAVPFGTYDQTEMGQMLLVPNYLTSATYFIGVTGASGTAINLDSRKQQILTPNQVANYVKGTGADNFDFTITGQGNNGGFGYLTYKITVPLQQIAWQVNVTPTAGNPDLYIRQGYVPNRWNNNALSEAPAGVIDSVTQVPPTLTDGVWYITVYGTGTYSFSLNSQNPVITAISYINDNLTPLKVNGTYNTPNYQTLCPPLESNPSVSCKGTQLINNDINRAGWRYYQVSDINSQLGFLGWQLDLANQVPGTEIALRRNAVPSRWRYRANDSHGTPIENYHENVSSKTGFLKDPGHQADIWYVGIYLPDQALGAFELTTREIPAPETGFNSGAVSITDQPAITWKWFRFTVPADAIGWDLRLVNVTSGTPQMVVRRDQLPADFNTSYYSDYRQILPYLAKWPSGYQWGAGNDMTGRPYSASGISEAGRYLVTGIATPGQTNLQASGMGGPLEPGTYYVGVSGSGATPLSYTLQSQGIGDGTTGCGGSGCAITVRDLPFAGGSDTVTIANPREAVYYQVTVPAGAKSWSLNMVPTTGEAMMKITQAGLPNSDINAYCNSSTCPSGALRQKDGREMFYLYPTYTQTTLAGGTYYVAVVSEGLNPPNSNTIGSGAVTYTITSGEMPIDGNDATLNTATCGGVPCTQIIPPMTPPQLLVNGPVSWSGQTELYGEQKVYRFRVPAGLSSVEVRLNNRSGNPYMSLRQDAAGTGQIPGPGTVGAVWGYAKYWASENGSGYSWGSPTLVTVANPVAGDYTLTVMADNMQNGSGTNATYDLSITAQGTEDVPFNNGSSTVSNQDPATWRYFRVEVPSDALGWDLRLMNVTSGTPQMVVRRDQLPADFTTSNYSYGWSSVNISAIATWPSGHQWAAGTDMTGRSDSASGASESGRYLVTGMATPGQTNRYATGMGGPLEPGIYYVGVSSNGSTTPLSYTLQSRGIGDSVTGCGGSGCSIPVRDLPFAGGSDTVTIANPREAVYYRVTVPAGAKSWSLNMVPTTGEALMKIAQGGLPNSGYFFYATSASPGGIPRQKDGREMFYLYPSQTTLAGGTYYIAVVSEGQNPLNSYTIGSGAVTYTITSGEMKINGNDSTFNTASCGGIPCTQKTPPMTPPQVSIGSQVSWTGQTEFYGEQKVYRFRVPAGLTSIEVRLNNRTGNPYMSLRQDAAGAGQIPIPYAASTGTYLASEGGNGYTAAKASLITLANPVAGDYTVNVMAESIYNGSYSYPDAAYDLEITAQGTEDVPFEKGISQPVSTQDPATWRYFRVVVPSDALGWELRLVNVTSGTPQMVVRRDQLPADFTTNLNSSSTGFIDSMATWPSGYQWGVGFDMTGRGYSASGVYEAGRYLVTGMATPGQTNPLATGMGGPLEPGIYYVGISGNGTTTPLSYTLQSRGIGDGVTGCGGSGCSITVRDLPFAGGSDTATIANPREAVYYRVTVPAGAKSWSLNMAPQTGHESMMKIARGGLPNSGNYSTNASSASPGGTKRQKDGRELFYLYPTYPQTTLAGGTYYVAVVSEGQNPAYSSYTGSGAVTYTITSGEMTLADKTAAPLEIPSASNPAPTVSWTGQTELYGEQKIYRFRVPAGQKSIEVRLNNRTGNPYMSLRQDAAGAGQIPYPYAASTGTYLASEGGNGYTVANDSLITLAYPAAGDYTITVMAESVYYSVYSSSYPDAAYDLVVTALDPVPLQLSGGTGGGHLVDQQVHYYKVTVPDLLNGFPVAGWRLNLDTTNGSVKVRVRKDFVPDDISNETMTASTQATTVIAPPFLSAGTWYVEVKATGLTDYTISSDVISADPLKHRRSWTMPDKNNLDKDGQPYQFPAGLQAPYFGDSGIDPGGNPIYNPVTMDQGTDLANGDWHFYRITVPTGNGALLRTIVDALSGQPELYLRASAVPTINHQASATQPNSTTFPAAYDRQQSVNGTMYGNWVPLDGRATTELTSGDWWLGVRAVGSNIRYRLKVAAGNVRTATGPVDTTSYLQDLNQNGDLPKTGQLLAAGDMRYYRIVVPQSSTTLADSTPLNWNVTLAKQLGDVRVFVRDTIPPGLGANGNIKAYIAYPTYYADASPFFQDWYDDNSAQYPNPYIVLQNSGTTTLNLPPVKPGKAYYLGVYALTDATFDISSAIDPNPAKRLALSGILSFIANPQTGVASKTLTAGEKAIYRIDVPGDAVYWRHTAVNSTGINLYLHQDTVPPNNTYAHWYSYGPANGVFSKYFDTTAALNNYPWQPGHNYYLLVENTSTGPLPFTFTMDGRTSMSNLNVTLAGSGDGKITSYPVKVDCSSGVCNYPIVPYTSTYLYATPNPGSLFSGWSGACTGTSTSCALPMDSNADVTATFTRTGYQMTLNIDSAGSGSGTVNSVPSGIACTSGSCPFVFSVGQVVILTATPSINSSVGWAGCDSLPAANQCRVSMSMLKNVSVRFDITMFSMSSSVAGSIGGTITQNLTSVRYGDSAQFTITPVSGYTLSGLTDNGASVTAVPGPSGTFTYTVSNVTTDHVVQATFTAPTQTAPVPALGPWGMLAAATGLGLLLRRKRSGIGS
jgi:hypothetical protein